MFYCDVPLMKTTGKEMLGGGRLQLFGLNKGRSGVSYFDNPWDPVPNRGSILHL